MLLIKNGRVVDPKSGLDTQADVLVDGKKSLRLRKTSKLEMLKSSMRLVLWLLLVWWISMFISREPGQTHKEDIHTGAWQRQQVVLQQLSMANTNPTISDMETLEGGL